MNLKTADNGATVTSILMRNMLWLLISLTRWCEGVSHNFEIPAVKIKFEKLLHVVTIRILPEDLKL